MMVHSHDNWFWQRLPDGSVHVAKRKPGPGFGDGEIIEEHTITPGVWASIVASMTMRGESGETYKEALHFHDRHR